MHNPFIEAAKRRLHPGNNHNPTGEVNLATNEVKPQKPLLHFGVVIDEDPSVLAHPNVPQVIRTVVQTTRNLRPEARVVSLYLPGADTAAIDRVLSRLNATDHQDTFVFSRPREDVPNTYQASTDDGFQVIIRFASGGRGEVVRAVKRAAQEGIPLETIDEKTIDAYLDVSGIPPPDLILYTNQFPQKDRWIRFTNTDVWSAYAEYSSTDVSFAELTAGLLTELLEDFQNRQRRFGGRPNASIPSQNEV